MDDALKSEVKRNRKTPYGVGVAAQGPNKGRDTVDHTAVITLLSVSHGVETPRGV